MTDATRFRQALSRNDAVENWGPRPPRAFQPAPSRVGVAVRSQPIGGCRRSRKVWPARAQATACGAPAIPATASFRLSLDRSFEQEQIERTERDQRIPPSVFGAQPPSPMGGSAPQGATKATILNPPLFSRFAPVPSASFTVGRTSGFAIRIVAHLHVFNERPWSGHDEVLDRDGTRNATPLFCCPRRVGACWNRKGDIPVATLVDWFFLSTGANFLRGSAVV